MALTKIGTDGVKDDAVTTDKLANAINTERTANTAKVSTTINNNADNRVITGSGTANTLNGESSVVIDSIGQVSVGGSTTAFDTTGSLNGLQGYYETDSGIATIGSYSSGGSTVLNFHTNSGGAASAERMRIDSSGRLGIGTTNGGAKLNVVGSSSSTSATSANTTYIFASNTDQTNNNFTGITFGDRTDAADFVGGMLCQITDHAQNFGNLQFFTNGSSGRSERMRIDSSGRLGIGTTSPESFVHFKHATDNAVLRLESGDEYVHILFKDSTTTSLPYIGAQGDAIRVITGGSQRFRIDNGSDLIGFSAATGRTFNEMKTATGTGNEGSRIGSDGAMVIGASNTAQLLLNRRTSDGTIINFIQNGTSEGTISVSGSTVSLNGGHLSRWSQLSGISSTDKSARPEIYQGTVMSNLDELCTWSHPAELWTRDVLYTAEDTLPEGKSIGDVQFAKGSVRREAYTEENQQLNMTKVSDTEGDKDVAGVFWAWDDDDDEIVNDFFIAMTGDMVIRVAASTTVARGDLMISAGDGTAKPQADDIIRSSTIAKIISTNHTATYADGSKAYPCVLMAC
jgi:hypothetical protein